MLWLCLTWLCLGAAVCAQPLTVFSEFARINAAGEATAPESPREILSPALVRNGFTSFQVVVQAPADKKWWLFVGQNPDDAVKVTMYREFGDNLELVELPRQSSGTEVLWMDLWSDANARIQRIKVEPELNIDDDWVTYPNEGRVMAAKVPDEKATEVCPLALSETKSPMAALQYRNALQDGALAVQVPKDEMTRLRSMCDTPTPSTAQRFWTESYLPIRDYLFRLR